MPSDSVIHAMAGSAGGVVAMTVTYPLIFLSSRAAVDTKKESKSTYQAIVDIVKREGFFGLYSGVGSSLVGIAITNGIYYYFYERTRGLILQSRSRGGKGLSTLEAMLAGLIAGSATTILSNPVWVVQMTQATHTMNHHPPPSPTTSSPQSSTSASSPSLTNTRSTHARVPGIIATIKLILRKGGLAAFWRGVGAALVLVINPVLQYTVFEQLKNLLVRRRIARLGKGAGILLTDWDYFLLGALSKLVATSATYPYIVVKSRIQAGHAHALRYKSSLDGLLTIVNEEGVEGLYKGIGNKLVQSVLTAAILFAGQKRIYEVTKQALTVPAK